MIYYGHIIVHWENNVSWTYGRANFCTGGGLLKFSASGVNSRGSENWILAWLTALSPSSCLVIGRESAQSVLSGNRWFELSNTTHLMFLWWWALFCFSLKLCNYSCKTLL